MASLWLPHTLLVGPYLALVQSQKEFEVALRHCRIKHTKDKFVSSGMNATTHTLTNNRGNLVCIIGIEVGEAPPIAIATMLVHEAVHVWQHWCDSIGESSPSFEFEAYSIQAISTSLMNGYANSLKRINRG